MRHFGRILTAMVTPFNNDGSVNYGEAVKLAQYLVNNGSDGLVVTGSTGEAATLTKDEKIKLYTAVLEAVGDRATIIAGTGTNDTRDSVELTKFAEQTGVHGAMVVAPYYNKPPQEGLFQHFRAIAESTTLPLIVYNVPGRTSSNILPDTIARLAELENIAAVKEASGSLEQISEIIRITPEDFLVYSGDDTLTLPVLAVGGQGVISVAAHIVGSRMQAMVNAFYAGDMAKAKDLHLELLPFFRVIFVTTNPIPIKEAVNLIGIKAGPVRLPLVPPTAGETAQLTKVMQALGVL
ncbi:4-hydroxy-tetrahydrodipicolinate synthase [Sporomusa termitida]|uniref:4-hydroxy-tetrahydrodipicolinate synthase n=1 Tax=Sporomusa termitida TaxID=2377 RepID=A0A517DTB9_9FIRM|nr:4-hydroxy-tetrahydrodipicolinate synthase [Sporomusa termitida]QDR80558.1 4-hydroxy-tetrahydrodipicolinate synthase [Sporomusa termitida]